MEKNMETTIMAFILTNIWDFGVQSLGFRGFGVLDLGV